MPDLPPSGPVASQVRPASLLLTPAPPRRRLPSRRQPADRGRWVAGLGVAGVAVAAAIVAVGACSPAAADARGAPLHPGRRGRRRRGSASTCPATRCRRSATCSRTSPGFTDQSTLPDKIDESLSRLVERLGAGTGSAAPGASGAPSATGDGLDYRTDLKPWPAVRVRRHPRPRAARPPTTCSIACSSPPRRTAR